MSAVARSIYYFSFYLLIAGASLAIFPNIILSLLGIPPTSEIWIRLAGTLTFILGIFFNHMARHNIREFFFISLFGRGIFAVVVFALYVLLDVPTAILLFALVDIIGLFWTLIAYQRSA